jgi:RHS repeat-associated protein
LWKIYNGSSANGTLLEEFTYHPAEERVLVKKVYNSTGGLKESTYYLDENFVRVVNSSGTFDFTYVYHEGQLVAQNLNGTKYFIHSDIEGSSTVVTNASGAVIENSSYSPFGEQLSGGGKARYGYEAKEFDSVVGDTDFHARKYLPSNGIFAQSDTVMINLFNPQNLNRYSFEGNNPYNRVDPSGHIFWVPIVVAIIAVVLYASTYSAANAGIEYSCQIDDIQKKTGASYSEARDIYKKDTSRQESVKDAAKTGALLGGIVGGIEGISLNWGGSRGGSGGKSGDSGNIAKTTSTKSTSPINSISKSTLPAPQITEKAEQHILDRHFNPDSGASQFISGTNIRNTANEVYSIGSASLQQNGRVRIDADLSRVIGTQGETSVRLVIDPNSGEVVTMHPFK